MEYVENPFLKGFYPAKSMKEMLEDTTIESTMGKNRTLNFHCKMKKIWLFQSQSFTGLQCFFLYVWDLGPL